MIKINFILSLYIFTQITNFKYTRDDFEKFEAPIVNFNLDLPFEERIKDLDIEKSCLALK